MGSVEDVIECICCGDSCRVSPFATVFANVFRFELILKFIYIYISLLLDGGSAEQDKIFCTNSSNRGILHIEDYTVLYSIHEYE